MLRKFRIVKSNDKYKIQRRYFIFFWGDLSYDGQFAFDKSVLMKKPIDECIGYYQNFKTAHDILNINNNHKE